MPSYTPTYGAGDALAAQTLYNFNNLISWANNNNQAGKLMISETAIPGSSLGATDPIPGSGTNATFDVKWENVFQQFYEMANRNNVHVTAWAGGSEWRVDLRDYLTADGNNHEFDYRSNASSVIENNLTNGTYKRGVNLPGAEFSDYGPNGVLNKSHLSQPGAGYFYPLSVNVAKLANRGLNLFRLPVRWERIQPTLKGALDSTEMSYIDNVCSVAAANGAVVMLDIHNYARYDTKADGTSGGVYNLGQAAPSTHNGSNVGGTMNDCYADLWTKLATRYKNNAGMWCYDIMNEPHDLSGGASDWQAASRVAVEAIRAVDQNVYIAIEGYSYSTTADWTNTNGTPWQTQTIPSGQTGAGSARNTDAKIIWNGHLYFDPASNGYDGGYQNKYADELTYATNQGFSSWSTTNYTAPATNTTLQTGQRSAFKTTFDDAGDFSGTYDAIKTNTNTVNLPWASDGNPPSSMRVVTTATSDEGGAKKSITGSVARTVSFDFKIPTGSSVSSSSNFAIAHFWRDNNSDDLVEIRVTGNGGYGVGLTIPSGSYTYVNSLNTALPFGSYNNITLVVTDTTIDLYLNGSTTKEASISGSFSGVNIGGIQVGKYYGTSYVGTMFFDNLNASNTVTAYAPPNGGYLTPSSSGGSGGSGSTTGIGLLEWLYA